MMLPVEAVVPPEKDLRGSLINASKICWAFMPLEDEEPPLEEDMSEARSSVTSEMPEGLESSSMPASTLADGALGGREGIRCAVRRLCDAP